VWALPGLKAPAILRRLPNRHFILVGRAYVHGMMDGEVISADIELEDIVLE
jgi:hypothetical protein